MTLMRSIVLMSVALLMVSCQTAVPAFRVSSSVAEFLRAREGVSFCEATPSVIDETQGFYPVVALAQVDGQFSGEQLLRALDAAEQLEKDLKRSAVQQRLVMPAGDNSAPVIRRVEAESHPGCYVEMSSVVVNPYRSNESGMFVRFFHGGATGISGSVVFWVALDQQNGSIVRKVRLPIYVN